MAKQTVRYEKNFSVCGNSKKRCAEIKTKGLVTKPSRVVSSKPPTNKKENFIQKYVKFFFTGNIQLLMVFSDVFKVT